MQEMLNKFALPLQSAVVFFVVYIIFLAPTYLLPYAGSNSAAINAIGAAAGVGLSPQFWSHIACLFVLVVLTWLRGCAVGKQWIAVFPMIAAIFDMTPGLSLIPLFPTFLHLGSLIMGVRGSKEPNPNLIVPIPGAVLTVVGIAVVASGLAYSWSWQSRVNHPSASPKPLVQSAPPIRSSEGSTTAQAATTSTKASTNQSRAVIGSWQQEDGGSTCASTKAGNNSSEIAFRVWYCGDETTDRQFSLSYNPAASSFVDKVSGLLVKFRSDGKVEISSPEKVRRVIFGQDGNDFMSDRTVLVPKK